MIYVFYKIDEETESDFIRSHSNLCKDEFIEAYEERFKCRPSRLYDEEIAEDNKAINILRRQPQSYGFIILK